MFHVNDLRVSRRLQLSIATLAVLSLMALVVTVRIWADFRHEREIVGKIIRHLPTSDLEAARELARELQLQSELSILLGLNIIATSGALGLLVRAYLNSQRSLREVKVLAADVLASMEEGVLTTDRDGVITSITPHGCQLLGFDSDFDAVGTRLTEVGEDHAKLWEICRQVNDNYAPVRDADYTVQNLGHEQSLRADCTLLRNERKEKLGTVLHIRDVTERTLMEQRLRRMERFSGLGAVATGLHHEIKNPLSALSLHLQLLEEALVEQSLAAEVEEMLGILRSEIQRLVAVLESFRDYASLEELGSTSINLAGLLAKLVRLITPQATQRHIEIRLETSEVSEPIVTADAVRLDQVLLNLTLNALQAMPKGGTLTLGLRREAETLAIDVSDTGSGIPEKFRDRIFDPYFTTRSDGTGMGLALCEKIVRQHGGTIRFTSSATGTTFTVTLPEGARK